MNLKTDLNPSAVTSLIGLKLSSVDTFCAACQGCRRRCRRRSERRHTRAEYVRVCNGACKQYGPQTRLKSAPETPWWKRLLEQFENFLVIILLVAVSNFGDRMGVARSARKRVALRGDRHHGNRRAQRHAWVHPGVPRREISLATYGARRAGNNCCSRWRSAACWRHMTSSPATSC